MTADGKIQVLAIAGSLRKGSYNRMLVRAAREIAANVAHVEIFDLAHIPLYNADVEAAGVPEPVVAFHEAIDRADALLIATPEYQAAIPGVLKNALDWASRPPKAPKLAGKPVAIMGATTGLWGTARAQAQLRLVLLQNRCPMALKPEVFVSTAAKRFDSDGKLIDEPARGFILQLVENLAELARRG